MDKSIHTDKYKNVIALLRKRREESQITQEQLAKMLDVRQAVISKIENCERRLDIVELYEICNKLDISFIDFVKEINSMLK